MAQDPAAIVTAYLTEKSGYGGAPSILERQVQEGITTMARSIAADIVANTPQLRERLEKLAQEVIRKALADDHTLYRGMVTAVAEALTVRKPDDED
jgi:hypothetical protein